MRRFILMLAVIYTAHFLAAQDLEGFKDRQAFSMSGAAQLGSQFYNTNATNPRANPFMWQASGQINFTLYEEINLPFSFVFGRHRPTLNYPIFNQVGLSPSYKWAKVHLGYRNMLFSRYTLNNHTFLGAGLELNPGKFRLSAMRGRLEQGVKEFDDDINYLLGVPLYDRMATGIKIGVGGLKSFFDLIYFTAQDKELAVAFPDSLLTPRAENTAIGIHWRQQIGLPFYFSLEATGSGYNRDMDDEKFELREDGNPEWLESIFKPKYSVELGLALRGSINYQKNGTSFGLAYERVDPGFRTMGAYFINSDFSNITANVGFNFAKNKANIRTAFGLQRNNLYNLRAETSSRIIGNINLSIQPGRNWGLDVNYSNFSQNHKPNRIVVLDDTLRITNTTQNFGGNLRFSFGQGKSSNLILTSNYQRSENRNSLNPSIPTVNALFNSFIFSKRLANQRTQIQGSLNNTSIQVDTLKNNSYGLTVGLSQLFWEKKLNVSFSNTYNISRVNAEKDGWINSTRLSSNLKLNKGYGLQFSIYWIKRETLLATSFSEFRGRVQLNKSFGLKKKRDNKKPPGVE